MRMQLSHSTFTKDARSFSLFTEHLKQSELTTSLDDSGVLHVIELLVHHSALAILPVESSRSKAGKTGDGHDEFGLKKYLCSHYIGFFNIP
jgi:hypothetical protein